MRSIAAAVNWQAGYPGRDRLRFRAEGSAVPLPSPPLTFVIPSGGGPGLAAGVEGSAVLVRIHQVGYPQTLHSGDFAVRS